ncbi:MAG: Asp-tRNA(Asn)/Glu-tRNA(Gln) amidotransferase subunit GatC [Thermostichales cyanobacterium SZTDM-1c_bins_54]
MISRSQVRHVAHLARLALTAEEEERFTQQLGSILAYVEQLGQLDTTGIDPLLSEHSLNESLRPDRVQVWADREALFANAPDRAGDFFKVPKILEED